MDYDLIHFNILPVSWKILMIIGFIVALIILILIIVLIYLFCIKETENLTDVDISEYDDFFDEFENNSKKDNGQKDNNNKINIIYPELPKVKDLHGNYLLDLLQIEIV